ncbi:hypothetical protein AOQ84DRAFT_344712 [Glonium stellatum]|uniref:Uncharacterized protein n=1 Tax=Glonium stellatum TaxID=574774 RepID=A0A8E2JQ60_9PEZI|nr:hypothetical protein AOQ84DRAFT_344712 [Glonium stellatum]
MHYFVAPLNPGQQTTYSLRTSQYKKARKRKRDEEDEPSISAEDDVQSTGETSNTQSQRSSFTLLTAAEATQRRVAGLLPEDELEIPPAPFPHAPAPSSREKQTPMHVQIELADLHPPLFAVNTVSSAEPLDGSSSKRENLRQTHLSVLTTILHHCLLEGDYDRAGRAWGMILRSQIAGKPIDVRAHGQWGIGAEILLRRNSKQARQSQNPRRNSRELDDDESPVIHEDAFSEEGFRLARDYYERLILQHPKRKIHPHSIDEGIFYPAMFSLWIYEVSERSKRAREQLNGSDRRSGSSEDISSDDDSNSDSRNARSPAGTRIATAYEMMEIKNEELRKAREIAERLDHLLVSPPFDKHPDLLQLRGMVGLWIGDLIVKGVPFKQTGESWSIDTSREDDEQDENIADSVARLEARKSIADKRAELEKARDFFRRARANGGRLRGGINRLGSESNI